MEATWRPSDMSTTSSVCMLLAGGQTHLLCGISNGKTSKLHQILPLCVGLSTTKALYITSALTLSWFVGIQYFSTSSSIGHQKKLLQLFSQLFDASAGRFHIYMGDSRHFVYLPHLTHLIQLIRYSKTWIGCVWWGWHPKWFLVYSQWGVTWLYGDGVRL